MNSHTVHDGGDRRCGLVCAQRRPWARRSRRLTAPGDCGAARCNACIN